MPPTGNPVWLDPPINTIPAPAIWDVSFELIDVNGFAKGWFWSMPPVGWHQFWLDLDGGTQGPWLNITDALFDITQVVTIRLDEAGNNVFFPAPPSGGPPTTWDWNAWNHLIISPEPSSIVLALLGLMGLSSFRLRRRSET